MARFLQALLAVLLSVTYAYADEPNPNPRVWVRERGPGTASYHGTSAPTTSSGTGAGFKFDTIRPIAPTLTPLSEEKLRRQRQAVRDLPPGTVIIFNDKKVELAIPGDSSDINWQPYRSPHREFNFEPTRQLARARGGLVGVGSAEQIPKFMDWIVSRSDQGLSFATKPKIELALVVDETNSMARSLGQILGNVDSLTRQIDGLRAKGFDVQVALVGFWDSPAHKKGYTSSDVVSAVRQKLDSDTNLLRSAIVGMKIGYGGEDHDEAAYDGVRTALNELNWSGGKTAANTKRVIMMISDSPPHTRTLDGQQGLSDIVAMAAEKSVEIHSMIVHP